MISEYEQEELIMQLDDLRERIMQGDLNGSHLIASSLYGALEDLRERAKETKAQKGEA